MRIERVARALASGDGPYRAGAGVEEVLTLRWRTQPYRAGLLALAAYSGALATVALLASGHWEPGGYAVVVASVCALGVVGQRRHVEVSASGITVFTPVGGGRPCAIGARALLGLAIAETDDTLGRYRVVARLREGAPEPLFDTVHRAEAVAAVAAIHHFLGLGDSRY
jgi:hypothetical protein